MVNILRTIYRAVHRTVQRVLNLLGINVYPTSNFYSPLPVFSELERTRHLWDAPSEMVGVEYDLDKLRQELAGLVERQHADYLTQPSYTEVKDLGYGPGFTIIDSMMLYMKIRDLKPKRYVEVGSGFSTYYSWLAAEKNREEGAPCDFKVVDPFPRDKMKALPNISVTASPVEEVPLTIFEELEAGDVLFIDTTHVLKIGGDVAYLFLEIVPRLKPGVTIHVHDIHFPFNVPYPAQEYIFNRKWPQLFTEAMILQAFLAYNSAYEIVLSVPLVRHFDEDFLKKTIPDYPPVEVTNYDTHAGSIWLRRRD